MTTELCRGRHCPDHGTCEDCGGPLDCEEWRSGVCDDCWRINGEGDE